MATVTHRCERCGHEAAATVHQRIGIAGVIWTMWFTCPACAYQAESDCSYDTPEEVRKALLAVDGLWGLYLRLTGEERIRAVKALRTSLHMSLEEAAHAKSAIPGIVLQGTSVEMTFAKLKLAEQGIPSSIERMQ